MLEETPRATTRLVVSTRALTSFAHGVRAAVFFAGFLALSLAVSRSAR